MGASSDRRPRAFAASELSLARWPTSWHLGTTPRSATTIVLVVAASVALGLVSSRHNGALDVAAIGGALGFLALLHKRRGVAIGLLVLAVQNGLPFLNTATIAAGPFALRDYLAVVLVVVLATTRAVTATSADHRLTNRVSATFGAALGVWWLITVVRSTGAGVPLNAAIAFGKGFVIFALLIVVFPRALTRSTVRRDALRTITIGALLYALGEIVITAGGPQVTWLVHPIAVRTSSVGLPRVYGTMIQSVVLVACLATGMLLTGRLHGMRRIAAMVAATIAGAAIVLQQTRAIELSVLPALIFTGLVYLVVLRPTRRTLSLRTIAAVATILSAIIIVSVAAPDILARYGTRPLARLDTVSAELSASTGNVGYRFGVAHSMLALLGGSVGRWLAGLGFLDPRYRYFASLPGGSLGNSDLGLMDGLLQFGLVGLTLIYGIVLIWMSRMLGVVRRWRTRVPADAWIIFGVIAWMTQTLVSSYSLGTLYQVEGQTLTAFVIALGMATALPPESGGDRLRPSIAGMRRTASHTHRHTRWPVLRPHGQAAERGDVHP